MRENMRGLLERALGEAGLAAKVQRQLPKQLWDAVMGAELAARAQPTVLANGVLHVLVLDHRWRDQLDAMRTELMARLNARLGKVVVRELRFGLAHAGALPSRAAISAPHGSPLGHGVHAIEAPLPIHLRCAERLEPELREIFLRAGHAASRANPEAAA